MNNIFYRFQGTTDMEKESYSEFISDIYFKIGGEESHWKDLNRDEQFGIIQDIATEWDFACEMWWDKYVHKYPSYENGTHCLISLLDELSEDEIWEFMLAHKLNGVFAVRKNDFTDIDKLIAMSKSPELGLSNKYLLTILGEEIEYFGKEHGYLIKPKEILDIKEIPSIFHKKRVN